MKKINVKTLKPGLIFSHPVFIEGDNFLVPANIPLRQKDIDQLVAWGIKEVETDGDIVEDEEFPVDDIFEEDDSSVSGGGRESARTSNVKASQFSLKEVKENKGPYRAYKSLIDKLDVVYNNIMGSVSVESRTIDNICTQLIQELRDHRDSFIVFILGGEVSGQELAKSSVNTAILSALTAQELKLANHKILQIVTAALLHDAGMLKLPREIINKKGGLSDSELEIMKSHPNFAAKIVTKELFYPQEVALIVQQHHERWDGKGYPDHISGTSIDMGARIVSVADAFEAMVSHKSYRNSMDGYQAMKNLLSDNSRRFDPVVLKAYAKIMGIYPIGSIVLLNNGAYARVTEVHNDASLRPKINMLIDEFGNAFKGNEGEIIDLLNEKKLFIIKAVDPKEFASTNA